jgi:hypothetical protein
MIIIKNSIIKLNKFHKNISLIKLQSNEKSFENTFEKYSKLAINECVKHKIESIINDYNYLKSIGRKVPTELTEKDIKELILIENFERKGYLRKLFIKEKRNAKQTNHKLKNQLNKSNRDLIYEQNSVNCSFNSRLFDNKGYLCYGLWRNSLFTRISRQRTHHYLRHKLRNASLFGHKLLVDMSFEDLMTRHESKKLCEELKQIYLFNKCNNYEAFDLHLFNIKRNGFIEQYLNQIFDNKLIENYIQLHFDSYLDHFSRENLVYLTPDANQVMTSFDVNKVYIIGGFVDKYDPKPLTIDKANSELIKAMKLPIDQFTNDYILGNKLFLPQVFELLNIMKNFQDYNQQLNNYIDKLCLNRRKKV